MRFVWIGMLVIAYGVWSIYSIDDIRETYRLYNVNWEAHLEAYSKWWIWVTISAPMIALFVYSLCCFVGGR